MPVEDPRWHYKGPSVALPWTRRGRTALPPYAPGGGSTTPPPGGGGGTTPPPSTGTALNPELPFELEPLRAAMSASSRKAWGHYFYTFPLAPSNTEDWYKTHWLPVGGIYGGTGAGMTAAQKLYAGEVRDRPFPIPALNRASGWQVADKVVETRQAIAAGFDGFMPDFLQVAGTGTTPNQRWTQHVELMAAVAQVNNPNFKIVPMVDSFTSGTADPVVLADHMQITAADKSSFRLPTGEFVLAAYAPERAPQNTSATPATTFWPVVLDRLRTTHGIRTNFLACFLDTWTGATTAQAFEDVAWMYSRWGDRDPTASGNNSTSARLAPSISHGGTWAGSSVAAAPGKPWMHPVAVGDSRPNQSNFYENWGWRQIQASWLAAIDGGAEWVQVPTWSDYAEHAHIGPSINHGFALLDVFTYFLVRWKLGYYPTIVRDALYLQHRIHPSSGVTYTGTGQTKFMVLRGSTPIKNDVSVAAFLTAPATINVTVGGTTTTPATANPAPAGFSIHEVPLKAGSIRAEAVRAGAAISAVASPFTVLTTTVTDDYNYRAVSSLRK